MIGPRGLSASAPNEVNHYRSGSPSEHSGPSRKLSGIGGRACEFREQFDFYALMATLEGRAGAIGNECYFLAMRTLTPSGPIRSVCNVPAGFSYQSPGP